MAQEYQLKMKDPYRKAMRFLPQNIPDIISWLGSQFVAVTSGDEIRVPVGGDKFVSVARQIVGADSGVNERLLMVIRDAIKDRIVIAAAGQWIVKGDILGIEVYNADTIENVYEFAEQRTSYDDQC